MTTRFKISDGLLDALFEAARLGDVLDLDPSASRDIHDAFVAANDYITVLQDTLSLYAGGTHALGIDWAPLQDEGAVARAVLKKYVASTDEAEQT